MDFGREDLDPALADFVEEVRGFLAAELTPERRAALTTRRDDHDPDFHRALGRRGWVLPDLPVELGGAGLDARQVRALTLELARASAPTINLSTTRTTLPAVLDHGTLELATRVREEVAAGEACIAMGYSEPDGGSDIAAARTTARRDGDDWVISGQKVFTTGAHHCRYVFLLTRTDPAAAKHAGLTMFLVPLASPGIEVFPLHTLDERTNVVHLDEVRVPDALRLGAPGSGWQVLLGPLNQEHGIAVERSVIDAGRRHSRRLAEVLQAAVDWANTSQPDSGETPMWDPRVRDTLAESAVQLMAVSSTWGHTGRVAAAEAYVRETGNLAALLGPECLVPGGPWDERPAGRVEHHRRSSQVATIYGGSVEVVRDVLAAKLGLPRWSTR